MVVPRHPALRRNGAPHRYQCPRVFSKKKCIIVPVPTCSTTALHPCSAVLSSSNVSASNGLKGFPVRKETPVANGDIANAVTRASLVARSSVTAALSSTCEYSKSSHSRCVKEMGSLKLTGIAILDKSLPFELFQYESKIKSNHILHITSALH